MPNRGRKKGGDIVSNRKRTVKLQIPMRGLEVYLVGDSVGWNRHESRLFRVCGESYTLVLSGTPGDQFKCFVHIKVGQNPTEVRRALEQAGYVITGSGDVDPKSGQPRIWFLIPGSETSGEGVWANMVWGEEDEIVFPKSEDDQAPGKQRACPTLPPPKQ